MQGSRTRAKSALAETWKSRHATRTSGSTHLIYNINNKLFVSVGIVGQLSAIGKRTYHARVELHAMRGSIRLARHDGASNGMQLLRRCTRYVIYVTLGFLAYGLGDRDFIGLPVAERRTRQLHKKSGDVVVIFAITSNSVV